MNGDVTLEILSVLKKKPCMSVCFLEVKKSKNSNNILYINVFGTRINQNICNFRFQVHVILLKICVSFGAVKCLCCMEDYQKNLEVKLCAWNKRIILTRTPANHLCSQIVISRGYKGLMAQQSYLSFITRANSASVSFLQKLSLLSAIPYTATIESMHS
jgi:hypothetical protein